VTLENKIHSKNKNLKIKMPKKIAHICKMIWIIEFSLSLPVIKNTQREGGSREWMLKSILTESRIAITALSWHPTQKKLLATATSDGRVCVWNVDEQRVVNSAVVPSAPLFIEWNPFERYTNN
jgi:WD40 repeat protein